MWPNPSPLLADHQGAFSCELGFCSIFILLDGDEEAMSDEESVPMSGQGAASTKQSWANRLPPSLMQSRGGSPIKTPTGSPSKSPAKSPGSSSSDTSPAKVCAHDTCCSDTSPAKVCEHGIQ